MLFACLSIPYLRWRCPFRSYLPILFSWFNIICPLTSYLLISYSPISNHSTSVSLFTSHLFSSFDLPFLILPSSFSLLYSFFHAYLLQFLFLIVHVICTVFLHHNHLLGTHISPYKHFIIVHIILITHLHHANLQLHSQGRVSPTH